MSGVQRLPLLVFVGPECFKAAFFGLVYCFDYLLILVYYLFDGFSLFLGDGAQVVFGLDLGVDESALEVPRVDRREGRDGEVGDDSSRRSCACASQEGGG